MHSERRPERASQSAIGLNWIRRLQDRVNDVTCAIQKQTNMYLSGPVYFQPQSSRYNAIHVRTVAHSAMPASTVHLTNGSALVQFRSTRKNTRTPRPAQTSAWYFIDPTCKNSSDSETRRPRSRRSARATLDATATTMCIVSTKSILARLLAACKA